MARIQVKPNQHGKYVKPQTMYYEIDLDKTHRMMYIYMAEGELEDRLVSDDGTSIADVRWTQDGLPLVLGVQINNPNKFSIIEDWIEDAIESAVGEEFSDDHEKGILEG